MSYHFNLASAAPNYFFFPLENQRGKTSYMYQCKFRNLFALKKQNGFEQINY